MARAFVRVFPSPHLARYRWAMRRLCVLVAIAGFLLTGCVSGGDDSPSFEGISVADSASVDRAPDQMITSGSLTLEVDDPTATAQEVRALTQAADGRIDSESEFVGDASRSISLSLRIPAANFDAVVEQVTALGDVTMKQVGRSDVTSQVVDLDARITALQASVDRLNELFTSADTVADLIAAETALAQRQSELDGLVAQREYLRDQVEMSALSVTVSTALTQSTAQTVLFFGGLFIGAILASVITAIVLISRRGRRP
jgi:hypothetical protein